jgi:osmotically inducible protein OsmC
MPPDGSRQEDSAACFRNLFAAPIVKPGNTTIQEAPMAGIRRNASVTWSGSAREGRGTFQVGSGALTAPFTYNSRFRGGSETNPEELLLAAQAGCLTMAVAAALQEQHQDGGSIETNAELDLVPRDAGGYRIPSVRLVITVANGGIQDDLDRVLERAIEMCPICHALAGTDVQATVRPAPKEAGP